MHRPDDIRVYTIECVAIPDSLKILLNFTAPLNQSIVQPVPIANKSAYDWELVARYTGAASWFAGPARLIVAAGRTEPYPITFMARRETTIQVRDMLYIACFSVRYNLLDQHTDQCGCLASPDVSPDNQTPKS